MSKTERQMMDGNTAAAHVSYAFTEVAAIYPITPSSQMAELIDAWSAEGRENIFGNQVLVREMQSEGGAAGALHGALQGGALASTYTASQGLLLMIPNMYKIAGELLPGVFHVSARSLASNALSIFGDHQDVMSTRQTGFALLASSSVQQCMDMGAVAHLAAIESRLPFLHFFDGFRTSHEVQKIDVLSYDDLAGMVDWNAVNAFRANALNPDHPVLRGTTQNPDVFFQTRESVNRFYLALPEIVRQYMGKINALTGRDYDLFNYYGAPDAEEMIIAMGSGCDTIRETIAYANAGGKKYGLLEVHLYRPFSAAHFLGKIPPSVKRIAVLDRTKEPGAPGEPLYLDVKSALFGKENAPLIIGGRFGLASKDFVPADVMAVFANLGAQNPRDGFTVSIVDDVTGLSLPRYEGDIDTTPEGVTACKFWGLGSDGTVGANKSAIKIIGNHTAMNAQAYFSYDAKKSGGLTVSHLRFGHAPIQSPYLINHADYIACHNQAYVHQYDLLEGIKRGGVFLLNCLWREEELEAKLPASLKRAIAGKEVAFYTIDGTKAAQEIGLGGRINMIMQAAFFKLTGILPLAEAEVYLKQTIEESYGRQGKDVVEMNERAVERGFSSVRRIDYPVEWGTAPGNPESLDPCTPDFVKDIALPMNRQKGDDLPVSAFAGREDGTYPTGLTQWEKREIAIEVPAWDKDKCIQCNQCAFVCPHAVLRPLLLDDAKMKDAPQTLDASAARGYEGRHYTLAISAQDCTGCRSCANICPAREKALTMEPLAPRRQEYLQNWAYLKDIENDALLSGQVKNVKKSQFLRPLMEFSGACAGCGETPYGKLATQLFGERMMISNAAGCSTVWGGSAPGISYTSNNRGHGPAWGFSLFEDNAEYGYGMFLGWNAVRQGLKKRAEQALAKGAGAAQDALARWIDGFDRAEGTRQRADALIDALKDADAPPLREIARRSDYFVKRSQWIFGGDGWAYDIGYGGLDHVLASGEDVNVLVFDTEVYSNTGGQSSKATPTAAIAQFAASGKKTRKKDLGRMAMSYGYVYVAQVAMGASMNQTLKAFQEAESYPGPSLIIAYSPCVNHGIKSGMAFAQQQQKKAVEAGYWALYRHDPRREERPFALDSKPPTGDFKAFLMSEVRYAALERQFPERAQALFARAEADAAARLQSYVGLAKAEGHEGKS